MKKIAKAAVAGAAIATAAVAGVAGAGTASADASNELAYLQLINAHGNTVYNARVTINRGYQLCGLINAHGGAQAARIYYANSTYSETPNLHVAQVMVNDAASTLCPWTWANGVQASAA